MTIAVSTKDTLTISKIGTSSFVELDEVDAEDLRDQLLLKYPVEPEATPVAGPLHEVTLAEARPGDIATFKVQDSPAEGKFVCTLKKQGDDTTLYADIWLTANMRYAWCIRDTTGDESGNMRDLHIWRWDGVEEAVELPKEPKEKGFYITATSDQMLYNDGDVCSNWSRPHGEKWSSGCTYEDWEVVVHDLGPERLPLKFILKGED